MAQKLANPVAALISVPFQFNHDDGIGPSDDGSRLGLNTQTVIQFSFGENWNIISRTPAPRGHGGGGVYSTTSKSPGFQLLSNHGSSGP